MESQATRLSIYVANAPADVAAFESWLGRKVDAIQLHGGNRDWEDWQGSLHWQAGLFRSLGVDILWSVPLFPRGMTLGAAARGEYNERYRSLARQFVADWPNDRQIYLRIGWEFNGTGWNDWSAVGRSDEFVAAYRNFVTAFRSVSDKFVFEWTPNIGNHGMNPETAYPGDSYVDVIGMDFYYDLQWHSADPAAAWDYMLNTQYGLKWHRDFARAHGKPMAYAEWGVNSDTAGPYIEAAARWFAENKVLYQSYWNSDAAFTGRLSNGRYPAAAAAYKASFGGLPPVGEFTVE